jgi:hypothetical protein
MLKRRHLPSAAGGFIASAELGEAVMEFEAGMSELGNADGPPKFDSCRGWLANCAAWSSSRQRAGAGFVSAAISQEKASLVRDLDNHGAVGG